MRIDIFRAQPRDVSWPAPSLAPGPEGWNGPVNEPHVPWAYFQRTAGSWGVTFHKDLQIKHGQETSLWGNSVETKQIALTLDSHLVRMAGESDLPAMHLCKCRTLISAEPLSNIET